jgi:hypothetical protein
MARGRRRPVRVELSDLPRGDSIWDWAEGTVTTVILLAWGRLLRFEGLRNRHAYGGQKNGLQSAMRGGCLGLREGACAG